MHSEDVSALIAALCQFIKHDTLMQLSVSKETKSSVTFCWGKIMSDGMVRWGGGGVTAPTLKWIIYQNDATLDKSVWKETGFHIDTLHRLNPHTHTHTLCVRACVINQCVCRLTPVYNEWNPAVINNIILLDPVQSQTENTSRKETLINKSAVKWKFSRESWHEALPCVCIKAKGQMCTASAPLS